MRWGSVLHGQIRHRFAKFKQLLLSQPTMKKGNYVRLIKMCASPDYWPGTTDTENQRAVAPKPTAKENFWIEGYLAADIVPGGQILFDDHLRNGFLAGSSYYTSPIVAVVGNEVMTQSSLFRVLRVPPFDAEKSLGAWE